MKSVLNKKRNSQILKIFVLMGILAFFATSAIIYTRNSKKSYEYVLKQEIGVSSNCYYSDNAYCEVDNKVIKVDCYYEVE